MFDNYIEMQKNSMIENLSKLISYKSISDENSNSIYPFGIECNKSLEYLLHLGDSLGFRTKNIDGYCGYIEFGEGSELIGIIGHLDVVPADNNWTFPPFQATINDNKIYGRGSIDDKGPIISTLYAMKSVMNALKVNKRVRLIIGLNEEKNWKCINYYKRVEEIPSICFSPDADFPCIYAEKGVLSCFIEESYDSLKYPIQVVNINCNNNALNVVPKYCSITLNLSNSINRDNFISDLNKIFLLYNFNILINISNRNIEISSHGISAHSAHPNLGLNAISRLIIVIHDILEKYHSNLNIFKFFKEKINTEYDGSSLGINQSDESGDLTLNVGRLSLIENTIQLGLNLRIPVHTPISNIENFLVTNCKKYSSLNYHVHALSEPLYVNKNNILIQTLLNVYNSKTSSHLKPIAIGGATYARAFNNCVSFGPNMPGHKDMCHQADEYIDIDTFMLSSKIYAEAIYSLINM